MSLTAGARIGRYEIRAALGAGGMGEVYRAHDTQLQRDVAIKILPESFTGDPDRRARFEREAQAIAAMSHPNILAIYDTGIDNGRMYVVTELLEGETLGERLKAGAVPLRKALDQAVQIARGLAAAHDKQVVHRDLKPHNLFLLRDGRVKILDFGLARHLATGGGMTQTAAVATDPGVVMGTMGYMAPEQVKGEAVDARADLFALGAVLYEMLTGRRAFVRNTAAETMTAILRDEPPDLSGQRTDLPPALDRIVRHCLEKNPSERFQSARDVAFALEALSGPVSAPAPATGAAPDSAGLRPAAARLATGIALLAVGAMLIFWSGWRPFGTAGGRDAPPITIETASQVTADDGLEIDAAISPDGRMLAYSAGTATTMRVFIRPVAGGRTITLSERTAAFEYQPRWSPDGSQILYLTPEGAFLASSLGGVSRRIAAPPVRSAAWAPDGKRILVARDDALSVVHLEGGREQPIGVVRDPHSCSWSSTDQWIACASGNQFAVVPGRTFGNIAPSAIVLVPSDGGRALDLTDRTSLNQGPVWSPDGRFLFFVSNRQGPRDIYALEITDAGQTRGEPRRVSTGLSVQSLAFSATGQRLTYVTYAARANIWALPIPAGGPIATTGAEVVTNGNQVVEAISVSRDGRWLLYDSNLHLNADIFRKPIGVGAVERLTTDPADDFAPSLSPDGTEIAYHAWPTGSRDVYVKKIDGGLPQPVTTSPSQESYPTWAPDGRSLAFFDQQVESGTARGLFVVRRESSGGWGAPVSVRVGGGAGEWSPDGRFLVTVRSGGIEVIDARSHDVRVAYAPSGAGDPRAEGVRLSADGRTLYFKAHDADERASLWSLPVSGGTPRVLVRFTDLARPSIRADFAVSASHFYFTLEERQADIWVADVARR